MVTMALSVICCKIVNLQGRPISRLWVSESYCEGGGVGVIYQQMYFFSIYFDAFLCLWLIFDSSWSCPPHHDRIQITGFICPLWSWSQAAAHCIIGLCWWLTQNTRMHTKGTHCMDIPQKMSPQPPLHSINIYPGVHSPTSASHASAPTSLITQRGSQKAFPVTTFQLHHLPLLAFSTSVLWKLWSFQLVTRSGLLNVAVGDVLSELDWLLITTVTGWRRILAILRFIQPHPLCPNSSYFAVNDRNLHKNRCSCCEQLVGCFAFRLTVLCRCIISNHVREEYVWAHLCSAFQHKIKSTQSSSCCWQSQFLSQYFDGWKIRSETTALFPWQPLDSLLSLRFVDAM